MDREEAKEIVEESQELERGDIIDRLLPAG